MLGFVTRVLLFLNFQPHHAPWLDPRTAHCTGPTTIAPSSGSRRLSLMRIFCQHPGPMLGPGSCHTLSVPRSASRLGADRAPLVSAIRRTRLCLDHKKGKSNAITSILCQKTWPALPYRPRAAAVAAVNPKPKRPRPRCRRGGPRLAKRLPLPEGMQMCCDGAQDQVAA